MTHHRVNPYYVRQKQQWAIDTERQRHAQALYTFGEWAMFALMWHIDDHLNGLVERCRTCYAGSKVAEHWKQPEKNKCLDCFGTTFEGGFKAIIIRPAIFADTDEGEQVDRRGVVHSDDVSIESTPDFRIRSGDYAFRADGTRWRLRVPERVTLRTGFDTPTQVEHAVGYNNARAQLEDPTSVAYLIPPTDASLIPILGTQTRWPVDFSAYETIRAPLIPVPDIEEADMG